MIIFRKPVSGLSEAALARFAARARRAVRLRDEINIAVTSNRELRTLNRRFRGRNKPTDVLSFPAMNGFRGFAGDIAVSGEIAARNAAELGHTVADEIKILTLHGILHLAGYDHEVDDGEMQREEARLRKALGLPAGLIERNGNSRTRQEAPAPRAMRRARTKQKRSAEAIV